MNMLLVYKVLGLSAEETQVLLWDRFGDGPYHDLIQRAFSAKHSVLRHTHYKGKVWCYYIMYYYCSLGYLRI